MFLELIVKRRSIRSYKNQPVEKEKLAIIIEAALRAPSSMGKAPWEFIVVTDPEIRKNLSKSKPHGASFIGEAPVVIAVCVRPDVSDVWIEDAALAALCIQLAAEDIGLASCWAQMRERKHNDSKIAEDFAAEILGVPHGIKVPFLIGIGYRNEEKTPHDKSGLKYNKIHNNKFGTLLDISAL